jgi:hypothetical protein
VPSVFEGVKIMHKMTLWDEIEETQIRTNQQTLLRQGRIKFGNPTRKIEKELTAIQEVARLERMVDAILQVKSWRELLAVK